jgi:uncharacterized protein
VSDVRVLQVLSRSECLELLADARLGRVILTSNALPTAMPVNFALDDDDIVFRSSPGMKLSAAEVGTVVAFEVDQFDSDQRTGWSVVVTGIAHRVVGAGELAQVEELAIPAWIEPKLTGYVRIEAGQVTGRRLAPIAAARPS